MDSIVFTPGALIELLSSIEEFKDIDLGLVETLDGKFQLTVGSSIYEIDAASAIPAEVDMEVVTTVETASMDAYDNVSSDATQPIESGLLKEAAKALLVGGLVRLTTKLLK